MSSKVSNPFDTELIQSGNPNLIYAPSSDGYSVYAVVFHSPTEVTCSCAGFAHGYNCKHRKAATFRFSYVPEDEMIDAATWAAIKARIETESQLEEVRALFSEAA